MTRTRTLLTAAVAIAITVANFSLIPTASAAVIHPTVQAKKVVVGFRYARCTVAHPKKADQYSCADILTPGIRSLTTLTAHTKKSLDLYFNLNKQYCSVLSASKGGPWQYDAALRLRKEKLSGTYTFDHFSAENRGGYGDYQAVFSFSGKFVNSKEVKLTVKGKVTKTYDGSSDCAGVSFSETHLLKAVNF